MSSTITSSIKWSTFSEIGVKLITPISTIILARLLTPEAFGILAVCSMITSFSEIIADAGFGKYLIQAEFTDKLEFNRHTDVAFWSHFLLATAIVLIIGLTSDLLSNLFNISGYGLVIFISSFQLVLLSIINTQLAILRRNFRFKRTFVSRLTSVAVTFIVTIAIALVYKSYWAVVIGNLVGQLSNALLLFYLSSWKPKLFYSFDILKKMFSFSFWSLCEGLAHWTIFWFDIFIVSNMFSTATVGLYKNTSYVVMSFIGMITASMSPVLLSVLSRLKSDSAKFRDTYLQINKIFMYTVIPICIGVFFLRKIATVVILGEQWIEGANIMGAWALMMGLSVFVYSFPAEVFKSKGIPKTLFIYQLIYLAFLVPVCYIAAQRSFWTFVYTRTTAIVVQIFLFFIFAHKVLNWNPMFLLSSNKMNISVLTVLFVSTLLLDPIVSGVTLRVIVLIALLLLYVLFCSTLAKEDILTALTTLKDSKQPSLRQKNSSILKETV